MGVFFLTVLAIVVLAIIQNKDKLPIEHKDKTVYKDKIDFDQLSGEQFEEAVAALLSYEGFTKIDLTPKSGDYGVDIIAYRNNEKYVFQCKRYSSKLGIASVQQVYAGQSHYHASKAVVITNNTYTVNAINLAKETGVELKDRNWLRKIVNEINASDTPEARRTRRKLIPLYNKLTKDQHKNQ